VQANLNLPELPPGQRSTLEALYLLLLSARLCIEDACTSHQIDSIQRMQLQNRIRLFQLNESRLVERFPEIAVFAQQWNGEVPS
jgi:hypothetical protein